MKRSVLSALLLVPGAAMAAVLGSPSGTGPLPAVAQSIDALPAILGAAGR